MVINLKQDCRVTVPYTKFKKKAKKNMITKVTGIVASVLTILVHQESCAVHIF